MAQEDDEMQKSLLRLRQAQAMKPVDISGGKTLPQYSPDKSLNALMEQTIAKLPAATATATAPVASDNVDNVIASAFAKLLAPDQSGGLAGAAREIRNTPVADYQAEQTIENQRNLAGAATADTANNARLGALRVGEEFPGQNPALFPEGLSKLLPTGDQFKALPSGGYATSRSRTAQDALVEERKKAFALTHPNYKPIKPKSATGEELFRTYNY